MNKEKVERAMLVTGNGKTLAGMKSTDVATLLSNYKLQIAQALPKHLSAERMIQISTILVTRNPKLAQCTATSVVGAVMQASILGFKPVESLGHCYFVPYNEKKEDGTFELQCQFQIGYRGYIDLAQRSGKIKMIYAFCVYEGDEFTFSLGLNPTLNHVPANIYKSDDKITHVYAVAHFMNGGFNFYVLGRKEVEALRLRNPMQKMGARGAWKTDFPEMACAKAIKKLAKFIPMSDEMESAVLSDDRVLTPQTFSTDNTGAIVDLPYQETTPEVQTQVETETEAE